MKKFKAAPQSAKRVKAIIAAAMALTLAVPTTAYFSAKASKVEAEGAVPEAVTTVDFEKGFVGEKSLHGLSVVKSEQVLIFKEKKNGKDNIYDENLCVVYDVTDEPAIESSTYKYGVKGNQPSTAYDDNLGSVLVFDKTVQVEQFAKNADDEVTDIEKGTILQEATVAHSQVQIDNPFAGKDLANGASVSYWVKPVASETDTTKGANSTLVVFSAKDEDNRKADTSDRDAKAAEKAKDDSLSIQISANNDFHYVASAAGVSVAYEGDGSVLAAPDSWSYVTVTMTDNKIVTYVNGEQVSDKDVAATGLMAALADSSTGTFFGGNYSAAAASVGQDFGTVRNTCMDEIAFYTKALTAEEAKQVYNAAKDKAETVEEPLVLEKFTFENGLTGESGTTINSLETNKEDPTVIVDAERGNVLKMGNGTQSKSASGILSANPFAGKDLVGASVSYWVKQPYNEKFGSVTPTVALSFVDQPKNIIHPKLHANYVNDLASSVLYTQTDMEAYFYEGYTTNAYSSVMNHYFFKTRKNTHVNPEKDSAGNYLDAFYDEEAVQLDEEYKNRVNSMKEWHYVTAVFTNAGIQMYYDGEPLSNNWSGAKDKTDLPAYFGPRFFDGYYQMQYDGYAAFCRASDNSGARTLMSLLTADDTDAYIGMMYAIGSSNVLQKTNEAYYDDITYYGNALTDEQVKKLYQEAAQGEVVIPSVEPQESANPDVTAKPSDKPSTDVTGPSVDVSGDAVSGEAVDSKDDESVIAAKNAYSGKTGDTADMVAPVAALSAAAAAIVVASKKKRKIEE